MYHLKRTTRSATTFVSDLDWSCPPIGIKGYVERRINEKDKRIHYIVETEEAKKIHHQIRHVFQDLESQLMKNIDEPAQQSLQSMLIQILQNIEMEEKTC